MAKYKCKQCGYKGKDMVYEFNLYTFCVASNDEEPEYISDAPDWIRREGYSEADIGNPIGCPRCHALGEDNFQLIS